MARDIKKQNKGQKYTNIVESLKDVGDNTVKSIKEDFVGKIPGDFMDQLFGSASTNKNASGEIIPGESLEFNKVLSGEKAEEDRLRQQITFERRLHEEEKVQIQKKTNELRIQLKVISEEIISLAKNTQNLSTEVQIAALQAPIEPGIYHVIFFEKLLEFIKSFRKKIDEASIWLHSSNKRAQKKNYWTSYKKHGGKFLLSGEHYLQRSAG
ncbi:hypothetical protein A3A76_02760 [Candidatus Woesebacteria bacterium RIFCSPLOWO2_01_FULL_39_23]|uniref:DUF5660 domain-containing protein n=1 Tax=Candidatus Woesebacteria bacterium RIFCSPHIGHO2_01_FULL_40_22 TaxID=1802499 RepID=A0A1F7YJ74_9BACT|nr:MAG: hypothetical protein A2141_01260 [Candidatus Woesebacteria bacterium RBG_16_40_11]OGM27396.1 MAG: hypothetical protein A2628_01165 [Candidatus Woesebacteria bacterium RIFCSPHIGHO2_01_FULL_40_22]OGM36161.1 MAG: hypothetical protein A3E41_01445 [Candidatus Woesebacteria bacterium RIFCSPHIGHO2_12_FULL_38_9]OGM62568.1 MAG: hypothetical protein A3A76_02760 [Candidatus Woesebacteria bacterium RIFCSPLOWO2_01_FULL_39_23]